MRVCLCFVCSVQQPVSSFFARSSSVVLLSQKQVKHRKYRGSSSDKTDKYTLPLLNQPPIKPNKATCAVNYTHGNYNVLHRYLEPSTELGGGFGSCLVTRSQLTGDFRGLIRTPIC